MMDVADRGRFSIQPSGEGGESTSVPRVVNSLPAPISDTHWVCFVLFYPDAMWWWELLP